MLNESGLANAEHSYYGIRRSIGEKCSRFWSLSLSLYISLLRGTLEVRKTHI